VTRNLYVLACGAGPAADVAQLAALAMDDGWDVYVGATPAGWGFLDVGELADLTGHPPRHDYSGRTSGWPKADGLVVAPATLNTIGKFAAAIADCWALSTLTEAFGHGVPIVMAPHTNPALSRHPRFRENVAELRSWGVTVLDPSPERPWMAPWPTVLGAVGA
jgi:phosphopantothenoylcysteine synthetase/decarboxylase